MLIWQYITFSDIFTHHNAFWVFKIPLWGSGIIVLIKNTTRYVKWEIFRSKKMVEIHHVCCGDSIKC